MSIKDFSRIPIRGDFLDNKVVVVDGLVGGGKGLVSSIVGSLPRVEMLTHLPKIEQICSIYDLGHISLEGSTALIKSWIDEEFVNSSIARNVNCKASDMSSIFHDARPYRYLKRFFYKPGDLSIQRIIDDQPIVNLMTHSNSAYSLPIFESLSERLVYVRLVRCPMTKYMLNHLSRWSKRWGKDIRGGLMMQNLVNIDVPSEDMPFFVSKNVESYNYASPEERAVLMLDEWMTEGNKVIDLMKKTSRATIIEVPYEKFVFNPKYYVNLIARHLDTKVDRVTLKTMKKQGVPRKSLTDAPKNSVYKNLGWEKPSLHLSVMDEFSKTRDMYAKKISSEFMDLLDEITGIYIKRYDLRQ